MSTKKKKKSDEDYQEYFAGKDNNKNYRKISFAKSGCSRLNPEGSISPLSFHG